MLLRLSLNFMAHLVAGIAFGALAAAAVQPVRTKENESVGSAQDFSAGAVQNRVDRGR